MTRAQARPKLREIAILRTAKVSKSVYEWTQHVPIAKSVGVTDAQVAAMDNPERRDLLQRTRKLVIKFTDEVARNVKGSPATVAELKKHMGSGGNRRADDVDRILGDGRAVLETTEVDLEDFAGKVNLLADRTSPAGRS